jgi:hypothetical protein
MSRRLLPITKCGLAKVNQGPAGQLGGVRLPQRATPFSLNTLRPSLLIENPQDGLHCPRCKVTGTVIKPNRWLLLIPVGRSRHRPGESTPATLAANSGAGTSVRIANSRGGVRRRGKAAAGALGRLKSPSQRSILEAEKAMNRSLRTGGQHGKSLPAGSRKRRARLTKTRNNGS